MRSSTQESHVCSRNLSTSDKRMTKLQRHEALLVVLSLVTLAAMTSWLQFVGILVGLLALGLRFRCFETEVDDPAKDPNVDAVKDIPPEISQCSKNALGLAMLQIRDELDLSNHISFNSSTPITFENDLFQGQALFLVKTNPPSDRWRHLFDGRRRTLWLHVQGRFKLQPRGTIYLGGELPRSVSVGLFARSVVTFIMGLIQRVLRGAHFGFGTSTELPHCVFSLYQGVDELIVTPPGATPPPLGQSSYGEDHGARQKRRQTPLGHEEFQVGATYTFHFYTMYIDLPQWTVVNLPGMSNIPLSTFIDSQPMNLVSYALDGPKHENSAKDYLFSFSIRFDTSPTSSSKNEASAARACLPFWIEALHGTARRVLYLALSSDAWHVVPARRLSKSIRIHVHNTSKLARYDVIEQQRRMVQAQVDPHQVHQLMEPFKWPALPASALGITVGTAHRRHMILQQQVFRALTSTSLRQEYLVLTTDSILFYRTRSKTPCESILRRNVMDAKAWQLPGTTLESSFSFGIAIETPLQVVYVCFPSSLIQHVWLQHLRPSSSQTCQIWSQSNYNLTSPARPVVLNTRRLFPSDGAPIESPHQAIATSIQAIHQWNASDPKELEGRELTNFHDAVSALRFVDLAKLSTHEDKLSFYLNLHNCLRWHAEMYLPPSAQSFAAYCVGVQELTLTLADIDQGLLRSSSSSPKFKALELFALTTVDFRAAFGLQVASDSIPLFEPTRVHDQLNMVCSQFLNATVSVDMNQRLIRMPDLCYNYRYDFSARGSAVDCIRKILGFVNDTLGRDIEALLDGDAINVTYLDATRIRITLEGR
ncbi:unnamed protein product [Aphanomyces euteiches]